MKIPLREIAKQSNIHERQIVRLLDEFGWIIRFKDLELVINTDYLVNNRGRICFTKEGLREFNFNMMKKFRGGK